MLQSIINRIITAQERSLGVSLEYLRDLARASRSAFAKFAFFAPFATHRKALPLDAFHVARLGATQVEDCGTCVQIVVNVARKEGVSPDILKAALAGDEAALPGSLGEVLRFSRVVSQGADDSELREKLRSVYGEAGLVELAMAIATSRVYPAIKRSLGHAVACSLVPVEV